jgi:hypothetical protein
MQGYKNWCPAKINASAMVENMSKSIARYVHQMAIQMVWKYVLVSFSIAIGTYFLDNRSTAIDIYDSRAP